MDDDLNDPRISAYKRQRRILLPAPPGPRKQDKAEHEREELARARANKRADRLHLVGLTDAGTIVMGVVLLAVLVVFVVVLTGHL